MSLLTSIITGLLYKWRPYAGSTVLSVGTWCHLTMWQTWVISLWLSNSRWLCVCVCVCARVCVCEIDQKTILEPQACSENPFLFFKFTVGEYSPAATTSKYLANYGIIYRCYLQDIRQIFSCFQNISLSSSITTIIFGIAVLFLLLLPWSYTTNPHVDFQFVSQLHKKWNHNIEPKKEKTIC